MYGLSTDSRSMPRMRLQLCSPSARLDGGRCHPFSSDDHATEAGVACASTTSTLFCDGFDARDKRGETRIECDVSAGGCGDKFALVVAVDAADAADKCPPSICRGGPSRVLPGLYVGGSQCMQPRALSNAGITHAISVLAPTQRVSSAATEALDAHKRIHAEDASDVDLSAHFADAARFIQGARDSGKSVLVHCSAGISRSVTIVVAYLMWRLQFTCREALEHVQAVRPPAAPNAGFMDQLEKWEALVHKALPLPSKEEVEAERAAAAEALATAAFVDDD